MWNPYKLQGYQINPMTGEVMYAHYTAIDQAVQTPPPGKRRIRFGTKVFVHPNKCVEKKIFVDDVEMEYSIDITSFQEACKMGPHFKAAVQRDIEQHFTDCVSEMVGAKLTLEDIKLAIKNGYIEVDE